MIRSMTGYGRAQEVLDGLDITVEIRSVNHRYCELSARVPRVYGFLEEKLKSYFQTRVSRGKIDVFVTVEAVDSAAAEVRVNHALAQGYVNALRELAQRYGLREDCSAGLLSRYPDVLTVRKAQEDEDRIWAAVEQVARRAGDGFVAMREAEGERLRQDVESRLTTILTSVAFIESRSPELVEAYRQRLEARIREVLADTTIDEQRVLTEVAIFADKTAVAEETVRLRSHLSQMKSMLRSGTAVGRKLDFLVQEINREVNTIGSKIQDVEVTRTVVDMKAEIEKIREQIQNVE